MHLQLFWRALSAQLFALRKLNRKTWMWSSFVFPSLAFPTLTYTEVLSDLSVFLFPFFPLSLMPVPPPTPFPQVRGQSFKRMHAPCLVSGRWGGGVDWTAVAGELTSNMKVKWQAGHNKVSFGVPPFQNSQEQSGRKRPSQPLTDVPGRMFPWQTGGRRHSLMVPLITSNLHLSLAVPTLKSLCGILNTDFGLLWVIFYQSADSLHIYLRWN